MKKLLSVIILTLGSVILTTGFAQQIILNEDFEDGDFTQNPEWVGNVDEWTIIEDAGNNLLRLDSEGESVSHLSTASIASYGSWEFYVRQNFLSSDNNRSHVFLLSDRADVESDVNGYAVRIGESGANKFFRIVRFDNGNEAEVLVSGTTLIEANTGYQIKVERTTDGEWSLYVSEGYGSDPQPEGNPAIDNTYTQSSYIGIRARYTATRAQHFFYDDFIVTKEPPFIREVSVINDQTIDVRFSDSIDANSVQTTSFEVSDGIGNPDTAVLTEDDVVRIGFTEDIPGGSYELSVSGIQDMAGIEMNPVSVPFNITETGDIPVAGDVVFNEFFYDNPGNFAQYIELYNATADKRFNLNSWAFETSGTDNAEITDTDYFLDPGDFVVIAADTTGLFNHFGSRNYLQSTAFPELERNEQEMLRLFSDENLILDEFAYTPAEWGGEGVAVERRSASAVSYSRENWMDSTDPLGGTPGLQNTVEADPDPVVALEVTFRNPTSIEVIFDRHVDRGTVEDSGNFSLSGGISISNSQKMAFNVVRLTLASPIAFETTYTLTMAGIESIFGVPMPVQELQFSFDEPEEIIVLDEGFDDGDFTQDPEWVGNTDHWTIVDVNGNNMLELDAPGAGTSYLSTESISNYGSWDFFVRMNYATSDNNRAHVFLISDRPNVTSGVNGYAVRIGETGANKYFRIVRFDDGDTAEILVSGTTLIEAGVGYQIRVTRDRDGEWQLFVSEGYGSEPQPEGEAVIDNTHATASWLGVRATYTSTRLDLATFDDFIVAKFPIFLSNVIIQDNRTLDVIFSEAVDPGSIPGADFSIDQGIGAPDSREITEDNIVRITYSDDIPGGTYTLNISGIRDLAGGQMDPSTFEFTVVDALQPGDVVINEFFYDNPPDFAQYVELFNNTDNKLFNLRNWRIQDNTSTIRRLTTQDYFLGPGEFVVLTSDSLGLHNRFGSQNYLVLSNFPSLNRATPDQIKVFKDDEVLVDSLLYNQSVWGGDGVALERRSADAVSYLAENWAESTAPDGGTPGQPNTAEPDLEPAEVISATPYNELTVSVLFDRTVDPQSARNTQNYSITNLSVTDAELTEPTLVRLTLDAPMSDNTDYTVTISGVESIFGVAMETQEFSFTFLEFQQPDFNDIIVNEFIYRQVSGEVPRFIELYNNSDKNLDLQSWQLGRSTATIQLSSPGETIPLQPGEYLVISDSPDLLGVPESRALAVPSMLALSQNGDAVFLRDPNGALVDSLRYSPNWGGSPAGFSLERIDPESASNDRSNWRTHPEGHSAGEENVNFSPNTEPPRAVFARRTEDNLIEVRFNEFVRPDGNTTFSLNGSPLSIVEFNPFNGNRIFLQESGSSAQNTGSEDEIVTITNIADVPGNTATDLSIPIAQIIQPGDLVINEIMYQPISGRYNDFPDQSEYVEFYNRRDHAINLEGFYIHDAPDRDGNVSAIHPVSTTSAWIPANGYAVVFADPQAEFSNTRISKFFGIDSPKFFFRADRSTLSLSTQGDTVYLSDSGGSVIDSVHYMPDWHNPNLIDVRGIALERINPFGGSNDPDNWGSSVIPEGGTPGKANSLLATPEQFPDTEDFVVEPNPFSPDGDGVDDNLFINYTLNEPDYLLRVRIFDRYGRLVRTLADGKPAGLQGSLIWDGRRNNGMENRIGIYVIHFEAYNSANGRNRTFKKSVVLARQL